MAPDPIRRKLVIVGDGACGKTSLLCVFAVGDFPHEYEPTIFENYVAEIRLDGKPVQLALWDTAGQEEYERLRPLSYSQAHVILIAFSIDTPDSLDNVTVKWMEEVRQICGPQVPVLLVGCKRDLRDEAEGRGGAGSRFVTTAQGKAIAQQIGARSYHECSALKNDGVDNIFEAATRASMLLRGPGGTGNGGERRHSRSKSKSKGGKYGDKEKDAGGCRCVVL
ncbi:probable rho2-gtp binding protein rho2 [Ceraceosorus bombacis]|uniref:Probable rho2-gtp binding protein rho2 n=1 Tax=Ceraceosorus bombacis TaxID=401625 RepID=A0A0P1BA77_9BASI|nr:probable rho2-gtp binding protein rho2 [Ceraceosorus bombacis]